MSKLLHRWQKQEYITYQLPKPSTHRKSELEPVRKNGLVAAKDILYGKYIAIFTYMKRHIVTDFLQKLPFQGEETANEGGKRNTSS